MKRINYRVSPFLILCFFCCWSCQDTPVFTPKPRAFPRVIYPERTYQQFEESYCDFSFTYPTYARIQQDTLFFDEKPTHPCWFDLDYPDFNARLYCTYYPIDKNNTFEKLREDTYKMANKHIVKANAIDEIPIKNNQEVGGFVFRYKGLTATPLSFFLTDTTDSYLNGALYFESRPRPDSLAPVLAFIQKDIEKMIASFQWNK